jgi:hypothetical protein
MLRRPRPKIGSFLALLVTASACLGSPPAEAGARRGYYAFELVGEHGRLLPTYWHRGRTYVLGRYGQRYSIRVHNRSWRRVEAVVSVDGRDVIDGESADYRNKRGYIIPAYGSTLIDGFRLDHRDVASFRFGRVADSYAARMGDDRQVGVVGVAVFEERRPVVVRPTPLRRPYPHPDPYGGGGRDWRDDLPYGYDEEYGESERAGEPQASAPRSGSEQGLGVGGREKSGGSSGYAEAPPPASPSRSSAPSRDEGRGPSADALAQNKSAERSQRPYDRRGLGTSFGEQRYSPVEEVPFVRSNAGRPDTLLTIRYDDRTGLLAMGVPLDWPRPVSDAWRRQHADPFPVSHGFAPPPPGWTPEDP